MARTRRGILLSLLLGLGIAILVTLLGMLALSAIAVYLRISDKLLMTLNQILKAGAVILGVMMTVPRGGERGLASGSYLALMYSAIGFALYVLLGGGSFSVGGMLGEMLISTAVGAITGAIRANLSPKVRTHSTRQAKA